MAQIVFSQVGAALGQRLLPQGLSLLGRTISGAALGRAAGSIAGQLVDGYFAAPVEGPRLKALHVMGAGEGEGIASVYGRMRVGGQLIWASRFREQLSTRRAGGKGGPRVETARYTVSFAVALGEGPVMRIARTWANGEPFDLSAVTMRFHSGSEVQEPDPLIEMIEGDAPAYRGIAYLVFEDLPLEAFGNRIPQLSFEVLRAPAGGDAESLREVVSGVNIIPACGEFVCETAIVREVMAPGVERPLNVHTGEARPDFLVSLDQLGDDLPNVTRTALTVAWFGSDVAAGSCAIRPGVETRSRVTRPYAWSVTGESRADAMLISQDEAGRANYGGTPSDASVQAAIAELRARGYAVTLTPFLLMDAPGFPWRGRITVAEDGTADARAEIEAFVLGAEGYRRFILHYAALAAEAGGVETFLIGSEMRGLTRVRDETGAFPFVEALCALAAEVKAILPDTDVSYAADWTEYGAYVPGDGSGDVLFPLDALWAHPAIGFVGIDWYPPMGDWRAGRDHLDALAGYGGADDPDYLASQFAGGEAYDWYYASDADSDAQVRTPIIDTAHGEHWVFRAKDIEGWASSLHYARTGGVRDAAPTAWVPGAKPVRFTEIGFAAVDKSGNAPNLFLDPKSEESGLPPYSDGTRDDVIQRKLLAAAMTHYVGGGIVEGALTWAWDARPFPAWPLREDVWGDGGNWARGHWLNGRSGLAPLSGVAEAICAAGGVTGANTDALDGVVEGYVLDGVFSVRAALEPLQAAFGFDVIERPEGLLFRMRDDVGVLDILPAQLGGDGPENSRRLMDKAPARLRLTSIDPSADHAPRVSEARRSEGDARLTLDVALPLALSPTRADDLAAHLLERAALPVSASLSAGLALGRIETGDLVRWDGETVWHVESVVDEGAARRLSLTEVPAPLPRSRHVDAGTVPAGASVWSEPDLLVIDPPSGVGLDGTGPVVAAYADPWPGRVEVFAGPAADNMTFRAQLEAPAVIARLLEPVEAGQHGRWDRAAALVVSAPVEAFSSLSEAAVLSGGNAALLETDAGWELLQFREAELAAPGVWRLTGLLRGQGGSISGNAGTSARLLLIGPGVGRASVSPAETALELVWKALGTEDGSLLTFENRAALAWPPCHLRVADGTASWVRRGADIVDSWAFPDAANAGRFAVEFDFGAGFGVRIETAVPSCLLPPGATGIRVAEIGPDGRTGPWLSIPAGSPYL